MKRGRWLGGTLTVALMAGMILTWCSSARAVDYEPLRVGSWSAAGLGKFDAVAMQGDMVYCLREGGMVVAIDVSNPRRPVQVGSRPVDPTSFALAADGRYVYVASRQGLSILNVQQSGDPRLANTLPSPWFLGVTADAGRFYTPYSGGFRVFAIDEWNGPMPPVARVLGGTTNAESIRKVAVRGGILCAATSGRSVFIYDVSDPASIHELGRIAVEAGDLAFDQRLLCLSQSDGVGVFDLSQPAQPRFVGHYRTSQPIAMVLAGDRLCLQVESDELELVSVSGASAPTLLGRYHGMLPIHGLDAVGGIVAVTTDQGLGLVDFGDPAKPVMLNPTSPPPGLDNKLAVSGRHAFTAGRREGESEPMGYLRVFDVADKSRPALVADLSLATPTTALSLVGGRAFVGELDRLEVFDVADPTRPTLIAQLKSPPATTVDGVSYGTNIMDVTASGEHVFVTRQDSFRILAWGPAGGLSELSSWPAPRNEVFRQSVVVGHLAFVLRDGGLSILDLDDPAHPRLIGSCKTSATASCMAVRGGRIYVGTFARIWHGTPVPWALDVIDVGDPANPRLVGSSRNLADIHRKMAFFGDDILVDGERVIGHSFWDPISESSDSAAEVGHYYSEQAGRFDDFAVADGHVYGVDSLGGLEVVDFNRRSNPQRRGQSVVPYPVHALAVESGLAWFTVEEADSLGATSGALGVADVSRPDEPVLLTLHPAFVGAKEIAVSHGRVYLAGSTNGLKVLDATNPLQPRLLFSDPSLAGEVGGLVAQGDLVFLTVNNSLFLFQSADFPFPRLLSSLKARSGAPGPIRFEVAGARAFLLRGPDLEIVDLADPARPQSLSLTTLGSPGVAARIQGDMAWVARSGTTVKPGEAESSILEGWNIADPTLPAFVSRLELAGASRDLMLAGRFAYLLQGARLVAVDVLDPAHPISVGVNSHGGGGRIVPREGGMLVVGARSIPTSDGFTRTLQGFTLLDPFQINPFFQRLALTGGAVRFQISGGLPGPLTLQKSSDLSLWTDVRDLSLGLEPIELEEPAVGAAPRFFRVRVR